MRPLKIKLTPEIVAAMNMAVTVERTRIVAILESNAKANDVLAGQIVDKDGPGWHKHFAENFRRIAHQVRGGW